MLTTTMTIVAAFDGYYNFLLLSKIILFCSWFCLSIYIYKYILLENSVIKLHIDRLNFIELFTIVCVAVLFYFCILENLESLSYYTDINHNSIQSNFIGENSNTVATDATNSTSEATSNNHSGSQSNSEKIKPSNSTSSSNTVSSNNSTVAISTSEATPLNAVDISDKVGNSAIMTTAIAGGFKLAQKAPTLASKSAILISSVAVAKASTSAILAKDAAANLNRQFTNNKLISWYAPNNQNNSSILDSLYNLTGNSALDLLNIIQVFQKIQLLLIPLIAYNLVLYFISEEKMESLLLKILPVKLVNIYMKSFRLFKIQGIFIIFCLIIILYISNYLAFYYLDLYISNIDTVIEIYLKDFKK